MAAGGFIGFVKKVDSGTQAIVRYITGVLIILTVVFTAYTVFMRYLIEDPPFWGDTMTLFANIWLVMMALSLSVRTRTQISMTALYEMAPARFSFFMEIIWNSFIFAFSLFLVYYGTIASYALRDNRYWELNDLPKMYPTMIIPVTGVLCALAALAVIIEDYNHLKTHDGKLSYFETHLKHKAQGE
jgi:TRAP-type C4-dicarboxylate transport system permease small subunit